MNQTYAIIPTFEMDQINEMLDRALVLCSNPTSLSLLDEQADATASYAGAYGYSYQTLKAVKEYLQVARPHDPSLTPTPF